MSALDLAATMDAIAAALTTGGVSKRVYAWPAEGITVPCAVVGYPSGEIDFDVTFQRGSDRVVIPVYLLVGKVSERTARAELSDALTGATGVKDAIDGDLGGVVQTARVTTCRVEEVTVSSVAYLAARFDCEVYS